jgi:hypothetical protein
MWHCHLNFSVDHGDGLNQRLRARLIAMGFQNHGTGTWVISALTLGEVHEALASFWQLAVDPHGQLPNVQLHPDASMDHVWLYFFKD